MTMGAMDRHDARPLIAHVLHRFDTGGLENGVVNLINHLPRERFRHAVIALTEITAFSRRIERDDVELVALHKPPGQGFTLLPRVVGLLRRMRPSIVHTRNLGALEMMLPAAVARTPVRIHGEHGWDMSDPQGQNRKFRLVRRLYRPLVTAYVALSRHQERYLVDDIGIDSARVSQIYNGVDRRRFSPAAAGRAAIPGSPFNAPGRWVAGTVGRLQPVKNQVLLARAFVRSLELRPEARARMRLVVAGEGPQREELSEILRQAAADDLAWLAGQRDDVADVMRGLDCFVLPSLAEGISNTILEAMASGLPVIATRVGGNAELIEDGASGRLVPTADVDAMAHALLAHFAEPELGTRHGRAARLEVERRFGLDGMVAAYGELYERLLARAMASGAPRHRFG